MPRKRTICFVTGTRADFGLMQSTLRAIASHPKLALQLIVTGMHLDAAHGRTINDIKRSGWRVDAIVPWKPAKNDLSALAVETGKATARLADAFARLDPNIVLVLGDRVEAFAAATARRDRSTIRCAMRSPSWRTFTSPRRGSPPSELPGSGRTRGAFAPWGRRGSIESPPTRWNGKNISPRPRRGVAVVMRC
jgi:hypothetical protein